MKTLCSTFSAFINSNENQLIICATQLTYTIFTNHRVYFQQYSLKMLWINRIRISESQPAIPTNFVNLKKMSPYFMNVDIWLTFLQAYEHIIYYFFCSNIFKCKIQNILLHLFKYIFCYIRQQLPQLIAYFYSRCQ